MRKCLMALALLLVAWAGAAHAYENGQTCYGPTLTCPAGRESHCEWQWKTDGHISWLSCTCWCEMTGDTYSACREYCTTQEMQGGWDYNDCMKVCDLSYVRSA